MDKKVNDLAKELHLEIGPISPFQAKQVAKYILSKNNWVRVDEKKVIKPNSMHWIYDSDGDINECWNIHGEWKDCDGELYEKIHKCKITHYQEIMAPSPPKQD